MPNPIGRALRNRRAGHDKLIWERAELLAPENFTLTSPAFQHGEPIPEKYRGHLFGTDLSPALEWTDPPAGTRELVLIVEDPDAPSSKPPTHLLTAGIDPNAAGVPEGGLAKASTIAGLRHGRAMLGHRGWAGPAPVPSHGPHDYVFDMFALDGAFELGDNFTLADAVKAMAGHVVGRARLDGTYEVA
jgi:Raf kinase inhibitor-like YbhB/YbcL family protein